MLAHTTGARVLVLGAQTLPALSVQACSPLGGQAGERAGGLAGGRAGLAWAETKLFCPGRASLPIL